MSAVPKSKSTEEDNPHYVGHRARLRERLFASGPEALQDYELVELLLFSAIPRRDVKPLAKKRLTEFKNLWALVNAPAERLMQAGLSESAAATLAITGAIALRAQKKAIVGGALLNNWQRI